MIAVLVVAALVFVIAMVGVLQAMTIPGLCTAAAFACAAIFVYVFTVIGVIL